MALINKYIQAENSFNEKTEDSNIKIKDLKYSSKTKIKDLKYSPPKEVNDLSDNLFFYPNIKKRFGEKFFLEMVEKQKENEKKTHSYYVLFLCFLLSLIITMDVIEHVIEYSTLILLFYLILLIVFIFFYFKKKKYIKNFNSKGFLTEDDLQDFELIKELLEYGHFIERKKIEHRDMFSMQCSLPIDLKLRKKNSLNIDAYGRHRITVVQRGRRIRTYISKNVEDLADKYNSNPNYLFLLINLENAEKQFKFKLSHSLILNQRNEDKLFEEEIEIIYNELKAEILNEI